MARLQFRGHPFIGLFIFLSNCLAEVCTFRVLSCYITVFNYIIYSKDTIEFQDIFKPCYSSFMSLLGTS